MVRSPKKRLSAIIPPTYFQSHDCHLPAEKLSAFGVQCSELRRLLLNLTTVCTEDVRARNMFKSYSALSAEKYRQYLYHPLSIHPYSRLRLWLEILFVCSTLISNTLLTVQYSSNIDHGAMEKGVHGIVLYVADGLIMVHILANCFTGYVEGYTYTYVVLDLKKVLIRYSRTWLIVDLMSALSFLTNLLSLSNITLQAVLVAIRIFRMPVLFFCSKNITKAFRFGIVLSTSIDAVLYIYSYIVWNIYFQFGTEYIIEDSYLPQNPRNCSWLTMGNLWNASSASRFVYSMERAIGMLRKNSSINLDLIGECLEIYYVIAWCIAKMYLATLSATINLKATVLKLIQILIYHCVLKYIIAMYGHESAAAKYFTMTRQVEIYTNQRKLPPRIKKKILKFYAIRYQSCFFVEAPILSCVSGQLRDDIIMHTGRQLVNKLEFLKQLPRTLLLQIGSKLKLVIFIAGDIIFKINTIGDCLYFIDKGTVAVYAGSGKEVCHLEDGDFFGEIALVMKHRVRSTSVVAVTNCELFRLDLQDFNTSIACYPMVYEHIKKVATHRLERTSVIDEHHNEEMRNAETSNN